MNLFIPSERKLFSTRMVIMSSLLKDILRVSPSIENLLEEDKSANKRVLINYSSSILFSVHTEERERINIINKGQ